MICSSEPRPSSQQRTGPGDDVPVDLGTSLGATSTQQTLLGLSKTTTAATSDYYQPYGGDDSPSGSWTTTTPIQYANNAIKKTHEKLASDADDACTVGGAADGLRYTVWGWRLVAAIGIAIGVIAGFGLSGWRAVEVASLVLVVTMIVAELVDRLRNG